MAESEGLENVMVPVPEEHVDKVLRYVRWSSLPGFSHDWSWSAEDLSAFADRLDDRARHLLVLVAQRSLALSPVSVGAASETVGGTPRETLGLVFELNGAAGAAGSALGLIPDMGPANRDDWTLNLPQDVARAIAMAIGNGNGNEDVVGDEAS